MAVSAAPSIIAILLLLLLVVSAFLGIVLSAVFMRGRPIDDHPVCKKCKYDLFGTPEPREACPECGTDLSAHHAIQKGNRKKRKGPLVASALFTLLSLTLLVIIGFNTLGSTNFNPYKPFWFLKLEATTPALGSKGGALDELLNRTKNGNLSAGKLDALMDATLTVQADPTITWDPTWGDLFGELFLQGIGTQQQHEQYARLIYNFEVKIRPSVPAGKSVSVRVRRSHYRGQGNHISFYYAEHGDIIQINNITLDRTRQGNSGSGFTGGNGYVGGGRSINTGRPPFDQLTPGKYTLMYNEPTEIHLGGANGPLIAKFDRSATLPIELLPADANEVELFKDPKAEAAMEAAISIKDNRIQVKPQRHNPDQLTADIEVVMDGTPAPFGYQLIVLHNDQEYELAKIARNDPASNTSHSFNTDWPDEITTAHVDILFRPDADAARATPDVYRILDHEFIIEDVEVVRVP